MKFLDESDIVMPDTSVRVVLLLLMVGMMTSMKIGLRPLVGLNLPIIKGNNDDDDDDDDSNDGSNDDTPNLDGDNDDECNDLLSTL